MLTISYVANLAVLLPLLAAFYLAPARMELVFGPATDARSILVCLYATIASASVLGLGLIASGRWDTAVSLAIPLFGLQIVYKLMTVPMVGLTSPVVVTNLVVVAIHSATLLSLTRS